MSRFGPAQISKRARRTARKVVRNAPLVPLTGLPGRGGDIARRSVLSKAAELLAQRRHQQALDLLDRVPAGQLPPRGHALRAQALDKLEQSDLALVAARESTVPATPDVLSLLTHLRIARLMGERSDEADVVAKAVRAQPRNTSQAERLAVAFRTEDADLLEAFIQQVRSWDFAISVPTAVRLDTDLLVARGATEQDVVAIAAAEAAESQEGVDHAVLRVSPTGDWRSLAALLRGRVVSAELAKLTSLSAQRAFKAGWAHEAVTIAESAIRSRTGQGMARNVHMQAMDQVEIARSGWPVEAPLPRSYEVDPRSTLSVLAQSLPHRSGGYATRSHGILKGLRALEWEAQAVTRLGFPYDRWPSRSTQEVPDCDVVDGIVYHRLLEPGERAYLTAPMSSYIERFTHRIMEQATAQRAALIHASSFQNNGLAGLAAARRLGIPFVYEMRGLEDLMKVSRRSDFAQTAAYRYMTGLENHIVAQADLTFVITEALREEMIRRGGPADRIAVLPNGVHTADFEPRPRDEALLAELGLSGRTVIGYAGGLVDYEGLDLLLEAAAELKQERSDFAVVIVGDGHMEGRLHTMSRDLGVSDVVLFTGRLPHAQIPRYLSIFDIAPFPRLPLPVCELISPIKPFEAMAMGKAVIASSVAALTEIVQPDVRGLIFAKGDSCDLAAALRRYLDSAELRQEMGQAAREWVLVEGDWSDVVTVVDEAYYRLTQAS